MALKGKMKKLTSSFKNENKKIANKQKQEQNKRITETVLT